MNAWKVGVVTIGDERREFYHTRIRIVEEENAKLQSVLERDYEVVCSDIICDFQQANQCIDMLHQQGVICVIIHLPIWGMPSLVPRIAQASNLPVVLLGNRRPDSSSLVALLAAAGMLDQTGKECIRIAGDVTEAETEKELKSYIQACYVVNRLKRSRYCALGGRSIGIGTTMADPLQWQELFGVDFDHCDQLELVWRAERMAQEPVRRHWEWLESHVGSIQYGGGLTAGALERQIRSYLALKELAAERNYDFIGLKCQTELSDGYVLQCLGTALMNGILDADGMKKPVPVSCECDCDGALTMYLLSLCAGEAPSSLLDIKFFSGEKKEFILANCGSLTPFLVPGESPSDSLRQVNLLPHVFGKAGGASLQFVAAAGHTTVARLCRNKGRYVMHCFEGEAEYRPLEELRKTTWCYPHQFIRAEIDYEVFFQTIGSNHLHVVYGSYTSTLKKICDILKIQFICYNNSDLMS